MLFRSGTPIGLVKLKSEIHRDGDLHRTIHLWIVTSDLRLLLQLRASTKVNHPSLWDVSVAGHVDAGERAEEAAMREAREELGIEIGEAELVHIGTIRERWVMREGTYIDNEIEEVYVVRREVELNSLTLQASEVDDVELVPLARLRDRVASRDEKLVPHWEEFEALIESLE